MAEKLTVNLGPNLDWLEVHGLPRWIDDLEYRFSTNLPAAERFDAGDVLVWAQRNNQRFVYVGKLVHARVARADGVLRFDRFERFRRPVVICDEGVDNREEFYGSEKGFYSDFSYIPREAFDRVLRHADREAEDR